MSDQPRISLPKLKENHRVFADAYLLSGNARQSAKEAGFADTKAIDVTANRLLKRPDILAYMAAKRQRIEEQHEIKLRDRIQNELEALAFTDLGPFVKVNDDGQVTFDFSTATPEQLRAIGRATTAIKTKKTRRYDNRGNLAAEEHDFNLALADKYRGLEMLGKIEGMFKSDEHRVVVDVADRLLQARRRVASLPSD